MKPESIAQNERNLCVVSEYINSSHKALPTLRNIIVLHSDNASAYIHTYIYVLDI